MTNAELIQEIRKEIINRIDKRHLSAQAKNELVSILSFLDSHPEQSVIKKSNALFDECVKNCDPAVMKEVSDNIDKMLGRQPVEGLEEAAERYNEMMSWAWEAPNYPHKAAFIAGAEWQKDKILKLIELRISEIIGDAQPNPVLRIELQSILDKIK